MSTSFYNVMGVLTLYNMVKKCQFCALPIEHPLFVFVTHVVKCCVGKSMIHLQYCYQGKSCRPDQK